MVKKKFNLYLGHSRYEYEDILLSDYQLPSESNDDDDDDDVIQENTIQCQLCQDMYSEFKMESHLLAVHGVLEWNSEDFLASTPQS